MKSILKICTALILSGCIIPCVANEEISFASEDTSTAEVKPKKSNFFLNVRANGEFVEDGISFTISGGGESKQYVTNRGSIFPKFTNGVEYTISLNENEKYTMNAITVTARLDSSGFAHLYSSNGEEVDWEGLFLKLKATTITDSTGGNSTPTPKETTETEMATLQYVAIQYKNKVISDVVKFDIVDKSTGLVVTTATSNISMLNGIELDSSKEYTLKLQENAKYSFTPLDFKFNYDDGFGEYIPVKISNDDLLTSLVLEDKVATPKPAKPVNKRLSLEVKSEDVLVRDPLTFVISKLGGDTISTTSRAGTISPILNVKDGDTFDISLNANDVYEMQNLRFIYKLNQAGSLLPYVNGELSNQLLELVLNKKQPKIVEDTTVATIPQFSVVDTNSLTSISDELTFVITNKETNESKEVASTSGKLPELKLKKENSYIITLKENSNYTMTPFEFYVMGDGYPLNDETFEEMNKIKISKVEVADTTPIHKILELNIQDKNGELILEPLTFIVTNDTRNITKEYVSVNGKLPRVDMYDDEDYTFSLKANDKYTMNDYHLYAIMAHYPINLDDPNERYIEELVLTKKENNTSNQGGMDNNTGNVDNKNDVNNSKQTEITLVNLENTPITEKVTIGLYDYDTDELIKIVDVVNGVVSDLGLEGDVIYVAKLISDKYRFAEDYNLGVNYDNKVVRLLVTPTPKVVDFNNKFVVVNKADSRTTINIPVYYKGNLLTEEVTFELISPDTETLTVTTKNGILTARLLEEEFDYYIRAVSDKYETTFFPIVIKQKPQGKFPYNHLDCHLVERITLTTKDANMKPLHKIENKQYEVVVQSEFYFSDLRMDVEKIDKSTVSSLANKDVDIYDISFKNIYRGGDSGELVKLSHEKEYKVTLKKQAGKTVNKVYYVSDSGALTEHQFTQTDTTVTFTTNHFSMYALEYADENNSNSNNNNQGVTDTNNKPTVPNTNPKPAPKPVVKNNGVTVTGIDFAGYNLVANKITNNVSALSSYNYELYDIYFVDSNNTKVTMQNAKYKVTVPKKSGSAVTSVYYVANDGSLQRVNITNQGCYTVTFETTHFSLYAIVYGANTVNIGNDSNNNSSGTRPCDKPQNSDGTRPCDQSQNSDGTRPCDQPQNSDGTRPCDQAQNAGTTCNQNGSTLSCNSSTNSCSAGVSNSCSSNNLSCNSSDGTCGIKSASGCSENGCLTPTGETTKNTLLLGIISLIFATILVVRKRRN